jgi:hypothetical protein
MKTDNLISALAADVMPSLSVRARLIRAVPMAMVTCLVMFFLIWGLRDDLAAALRSAVIFKTILPLGIAALAAWAGFALVHPGGATGRPLAALALGVAVPAVAIVGLIGLAGLSPLTDALATPSLFICLLSIPALAVPVLGGVVWALSGGAALRPRLTGAVAGLIAGALAASVYSLYCDQDGALFVLPAYSAAILAVGAFGAVVGPKVLAW